MKHFLHVLTIGAILLLASIAAKAQNVGIGTATPAQKLEIAGTSNTIRINGLKSGASYNQLNQATSSANIMYVNGATGDLYALPTGATGSVLTISSGSVPTWVQPTAGTVTAVNANSPLSVTNPTSLPVISLIGSVGTVLYGTGGASAFNIAGSTGQLLELNSAGVPTWTSATVATQTSGWQLTGNAGTTAGINTGQNFIGTTDAQPLVFAVDKTFAGALDLTGQNVIFGTNAGDWPLGGAQDAVVIGFQAGFNNEANANTFVGYEAGFNNQQGINNTFSGYEAGLNNASLGTDNNTAYGYQSLYHTNSSNNTGIGSFSLKTNSSGINNTAVGYGADVSVGTLSNATAIGYNAVAGESNSLILGSSGVNVGIGTGSPAQSLEVAAGSVRIDALVAGGAYNPLASAATTNSNIVYTNNLNGDIYALSNGTSGQLLSISTTGIPTWASPAPSVNVTGVAPIIITGTTANPVVNIQGTNANAGGVLYSAGSGTAAVFTPSPTSGEILIATGTTAPTWLANGSAGTVLQSNGTGAPSWAAAAVTGWALTGNSISATSGTNFVGTNNNEPVVFKSDGAEVGILDYQDANIYFGANPGAGNYQNGISTANGFSGGGNSVGIGAGAMASLTPNNSANGEIYDNVAMGYFAGHNFNPASNTMYTDAITAVGGIALRYTVLGPNEGFGYQALYGVTGTNNVGVGYQAGYGGGNISASMSFNTAVGELALQTLQTGNYNTGLGYNANVASSGLSNTIAIGYNSVAPANNTMVLGTAANTALYIPAYSSAGTLLYTSATNGLVAETAPGTSGQLLQSNGTGAPTWVTAAASGWTLTGNTINTTSGVNYIGTNNTAPLEFVANGLYAGILAPSNANVYFGAAAGQGNAGDFTSGIATVTNSTAGANSVGIGVGALTGLVDYNTTNGENYGEVAVGYYSLAAFNPGSNSAYTMSSTAVGATALRWETSGPNDAFGYQALNDITTGTNNVAVGYNSMDGGGGTSPSGHTMSFNTAVGQNSFTTLETGNSNTALGYNTNVSSASQSNSIAIGANVTAPASNAMVLGNTSNTALYLPGYPVPNTLLYTSNANGLVASVTAGTSGQVLTANSAGVPTWSNPAATGVTSVLVTAPIVNTGSPSVPNIGIQGNSLGTDAGGILYSTGSGTSALFNTTGTAGQVLLSGGAGAPSWGSANSALTTNSIVAGGGSSVVVGNGANQVVGASNVTLDVQGTLNGIFYGQGSGTSAIFSPAGTSGQVLTAGTSGVPTWTTAAAVISAWYLTGNAVAYTYNASPTTYLGTTSGNGAGFQFGVGGNNAGRVESTTGITALGYEALNSTTGNDNTALGSFAGYSNSSGAQNIAIGDYSLYTNTASFNLAIGHGALYNNTVAPYNIAIGDDALYSYKGQTGSGIGLNVAIGYGAMFSNQNGSNNVAIGDSSLESLVSASVAANQNTAVGWVALSNATTNNNTAIGSAAGKGITTGTNNTAMGANAMGVGNTATNVGSSNVALGYFAMRWSSGAPAQNVAVGDSAMSGIAVINNGTANVMIGYAAGVNNTGSNSTAVGWKALTANTFSGSTAVGYQAMAANTAGGFNTAVGYQALSTNSNGSASLNFAGKPLYGTNGSGSQNTAIGYWALQNDNSAGNSGNNAGDNNTGVGAYAGNGITTGQNNTAVGVYALEFNQTGSTNTAVGYYSQANGNTAATTPTGSSNTSLGTYTLSNLTGGSNNVGVGYAAGYNNLAGGANTSIGFQSMEGNTAGSYERNTSVGSNSLFTVNTGATDNTAIGDSAMYSNGSAANNTAIGWNTLTLNTSSQMTAVGSSALAANTNGTNNTAVGYNALAANSTASYNTAVGYGALSAQTVTNAAGGSLTPSQASTAVGFNALAANTTGYFNSAVGVKALAANNTGNRNTAMGWQTLDLNTSGSFNSAFGQGAMQQANTGGGNTALGYQAFIHGSSGSNNTAVGYDALFGTDNGTGTADGPANQNTAIGASALFTLGGTSSDLGAQNTAVGDSSMYNATSSSGNTGVGFESLVTNSTGNFNTALGYDADLSSGTLSNATVIGYQANAPVSNSVTLGNTAATSLYLPGYSSSGTLLYTSAASGLVQATSVGSAGQVLQSNGIGAPTWTTIAAASSTAWALTGNTGIATPATPATYGTSTITAGKNWLGTSDGNDLVIGTNNIERMRIGGGSTATAGFLGIGTSTPVAALDISAANSGGAPAGYYIHIGGNNGASGVSTTTQGAYITWNDQPSGSVTNGETDFINSEGGGAGGFLFYNTSTAAGAWSSHTGTPLVYIAAAGYVAVPALSTAGGIAYISNTSTTGQISETAAGTSGQVLLSNGAGAPTWGTPTTSATAWQLTGNAGITNPASPATYGTSTFGAAENWMGTTDAKDLAFGTDKIERMRIGGGTVATAGYVGIGTATPADQLHVLETGNQAATADFGGSSGYNTAVEIENKSGTMPILYINGSSSNNSLAGIIQRGSTTAFYEGLNNSKNFRIAGITSIAGSAVTTAKDGTAGITVLESNGNVGLNYITPANALDISGAEAIGTYTGTAAPTNGLIVSGNVGIGTSTVGSGAALSVNQNGNVTSDFGSYNTAVEIQNVGGTAPFLYINGSTANNPLAGIIERASTTAIYSGLNNSGNYRIAGITAITSGAVTTAKDGTAGITILESNGNVGLNYITPANALDISGAEALGTYAGTAAPSNGLIVSGSVGIGTSAPAQALQVVGNVQFSQALMPNGAAGSTGNILLSAGAATAPTWLANGTSGQILTVNTAGVPTWAAAPATGVTSILVTAPIVNTGSPSVPNIGIQGNSLGTDAGGVLYSTGSGTSAVFNSTGTAGEVLISGGAGAPSWGTANSALTTSSIVAPGGSSVVVGNGANQVVGASNVTLDVQGTTNGVLYGQGSGSSAVFTSAGTSGQVLTANATGVPVWSTPATTVAFTHLTVTSSPYSVLATDYLIEGDCSGGSITVTLPPTSPANAGKIYCIVARNATSSLPLIITTGSALISIGTYGETISLQNDYEQEYIASDGSNWVILGSSKM